MASIFSKIVAGDIPCHKVAENDHCLAFLDIMPLAEGHTLGHPEEGSGPDLGLGALLLLAELHVFSQKVALAMEDACALQRVGQVVIGLEVPHAHVHLIPLNAVSDINFERPKLKRTQDELAATRAIASGVRNRWG